MTGQITKAVVAVAGSGTRFLPATKAIPKEMIPLLDRPIVQHVVEELAASGIEDVVFVTRWDKKVIEDHFDRHPTLEESLAAAGDAHKLEATRGPSQLVNAAYVRQRGPYGNGTPALNAAPFMGNAPFVYAFGDDLVSAEEPFTRQLIACYQANPGLILGVQDVPREQVPNYGMVETDDNARVLRIVEKPAPAEVTSTLVGFGRYILPPDFIDVLASTPSGKGGELWLMDAVAAYIEHGGSVHACPIRDGRWFTTGDPASHFEALLHYGLRHKELKDDFAHIIQRVASSERQVSKQRSANEPS